MGNGKKCAKNTLRIVWIPSKIFHGLKVKLNFKILIAFRPRHSFKSHSNANKNNNFCLCIAASSSSIGCNKFPTNIETNFAEKIFTNIPLTWTGFSNRPQRMLIQNTGYDGNCMQMTVNFLCSSSVSHSKMSQISKRERYRESAREKKTDSQQLMNEYISVWFTHCHCNAIKIWTKKSIVFSSFSLSHLHLFRFCKTYSQNDGDLWGWQRSIYFKWCGWREIFVQCDTIFVVRPKCNTIAVQQQHSARGEWTCIRYGNAVARRKWKQKHAQSLPNILVVFLQK